MSASRKVFFHNCTGATAGAAIFASFVCMTQLWPTPKCVAIAPMTIHVVHVVIVLFLSIYKLSISMSVNSWPANKCIALNNEAQEKKINVIARMKLVWRMRYHIREKKDGRHLSFEKRCRDPKIAKNYANHNLFGHFSQTQKKLIKHHHWSLKTQQILLESLWYVCISAFKIEWRIFAHILLGKFSHSDSKGPENVLQSMSSSKEIFASIRRHWHR